LANRARLAGTAFVDSLLAFSLFCAIAISITAFPVLARILADSEIDRPPLSDVQTVPLFAQRPP
jgi:Kef-type K+ transport system membrane component KefB